MKSILLIGLGRFGKHLAAELRELGHYVMGIDSSEEKVNDAINIVSNARIGNSTDEDFLRSLGVGNYDVCMVTISDDFQSSLETTCTLKELGAKMVISRAERDGQAKFLLRNGADDVMYPEKQVAKWASIRFTSNHILEYIEVDKEHSIFEVSVPKAWLGLSISELDIRKKYGINILGIKENNKLNVLISPDTILTESNTILVLGEYKSLQKCFHM